MAPRTDALSPLQKASKTLLGSAFRLEVAAWIFRNGHAPINPTLFRRALERSSAAPPSHSSLVNELNKLAEVDLLSVVSVEGGEVWYERGKSVYFQSCQHLFTELAPKLAQRVMEIEAHETSDESAL